jgi:hypothetical protein
MSFLWKAPTQRSHQHCQHLWPSHVTSEALDYACWMSYTFIVSPTTTVLLLEFHLFWLVVDLPLWKIWVRQLGWWYSQYMEQYDMFQTTNQNVMFCCFLFGGHHESEPLCFALFNRGQWSNSSYKSSMCSSWFWINFQPLDMICSLIDDFNPSEKRVRQLGLLFSIYGKNKIHVPNQHPVHIYICYIIYVIQMYVQCRKNNPNVPKHQPVLFPFFFQDVQFFTSHHPKPIQKHSGGFWPPNPWKDTFR